MTRRGRPRRSNRLQDEVAGPFDAELAAAGQAVILARRRGRRTGDGARLAADPEDR